MYGKRGRMEKNKERESTQTVNSQVVVSEGNSASTFAEYKHFSDTAALRPWRDKAEVILNHVRAEDLNTTK